MYVFCISLSWFYLSKLLFPNLLFFVFPTPLAVSVEDSALEDRKAALRAKAAAAAAGNARTRQAAEVSR